MTVNVRVLLALLIAAEAGAGIYFFSESARFTVIAQSGEGGTIYKLDRRTGRLWWVITGQAIEIESKSLLKNPQSPSEKAIALAKIHPQFPGGTSDMDTTIRLWLESHKGVLRVYGWKAKKIDDQTYLVSYTYDEGPGSNSGGWVFEVNLVAQIVRNVIGDPALEKKYEDWSRSQSKPSDQRQ